jgi:hypothetical protein
VCRIDIGEHAMTPAERRALQQKIERFEAPIVAAARRAGHLPVIDCTARGYPASPAELAALRRALDPDSREAAYREAAALRRKAASHRSLASVLERDGKHDQARALMAKAEAHEAHALALDESTSP